MATSDTHVLRIIGVLDPTYGGTSESSVRACVAAQRSGIQNTFIFAVNSNSGGTTQAAQGRLKTEGVKVRTFRVLPLLGTYAARWGLSVSMCFWILRNIRNFDIVHLHQTWGLPQVVGLAMAVVAGRPCVVSPHESLTAYDVEREKQMIKRWLKRVYLRHASLILLASPLEAADTVGRDHLWKSTVLPHPLEDACIGEGHAGGDFRSANVPLKVGFLGRLHPKKNIPLLIKVIGALEDDVQLHVAGTGARDYEDRLLRCARAAGVGDQVHWLGFVAREDRHRFFADVDVVALVSEYECFGVAAAEAMADGVAVMVSERTGIAPIVSKHACGFVVAPDVAPIVAALQAVNEDRALLARLAARGPAAARQELSMEAYGASVRRSYEELTQRRNALASRSNRRVRRGGGSIGRHRPILGGRRRHE